MELLLDYLEAQHIKRTVFYLDRQVSNSGRLRALLLEQAENRPVNVQVELHPQVDSQLSSMECVVTSDAIILDKCGSWYNLNRHIIETKIPDAWIVRFETGKK